MATICDETAVYQSATNTRVPLDDTNYVAWTDAHGVQATPIATEDELRTVLAQRGSQVPAWLLATEPSFIQPAPDTYDQDQLKAYSEDARARKQAGGITVNGMPFATDPVTTMSLNSAFIYTQNNPGATFSWKLPDNTFVTVDKQGIEGLQGAVSQFGQSCFACEDQLATDIEAATVTDLPTIDARYDAITTTYTGLTVQRRK